MIIEATEFIIRAATTAFVVIGVTLVVQHLGARLGGIVVGLPVVIGPGMYFLLVQQGAAFASQAAVGALFALAASVGFAWAFARAAVRFSAGISLAGGVGIWVAVAAVLQALPESLLFGLAAFATAVMITLALGHDPAAGQTLPAAARQPVDLVLRGLASGLLVGLVGLAAPLAGPNLSGMLLAFPITLAVVGVTLHQRHGGATAARTLATTQVSMTSIAAFAATLVLLLQRVPPQSAFWLAVAVSLVPPAMLTASGYLRHSTSGGAADGR